MAARTGPAAPETAEVCILLALYQGERYLQAQLESYAAQSHPAWSLLVSDDGSQDAGRTILDRFAAAHPQRRISCLPGPRRGFVHNFLSLLQRAPGDVPYAALSDQDDIWFPYKLERAVAALAALPDGRPALYCARTRICDTDLRVQGYSAAFPRPPHFRNALVQSIGGGNTMVLNRAALDLAAEAATEASDPVAPVAHDWWLYQLISGCGGTILRDPDPVLDYRQHGGNLIGANMSAKARWTRIIALLNGRFRQWNDIGLAALGASQHRLTAEARQTLADFTAARQGPLLSRLRALRRAGVYRQSTAGNLALYLACVLKQL